MILEEEWDEEWDEELEEEWEEEDLLEEEEW
ncbi:hypothetical protein SACC_01780 [Saccharolobus caldissimus]|jgi:hypothetical protein|uniref:Uncharacterized protein n=1 Tax=Saccharolobus caldissimus TaxID=1702097 RepID=A0AAQ4CMY0_9CREN|nr:hypothetical protein SACC_01780 [Saccharolobus caldissimus]